MITWRTPSTSKLRQSPNNTLVRRQERWRFASAHDRSSESIRSVCLRTSPFLRHEIDPGQVPSVVRVLAQKIENAISENLIEQKADLNLRAGGPARNIPQMQPFCDTRCKSIDPSPKRSHRRIEVGRAVRSNKMGCRDRLCPCQSGKRLDIRRGESLCLQFLPRTA